MQIFVVAAILIALMVGGFGGSLLQKRSFVRDSQSLAYYQNTMLRKQGSAMGFGQYELLSFDSGKQWYAVEREDDGAVVIRGTADEIFPGLLGHLHGMDALVAYATENGPLTLSGARAETDQALLESAGFTVTEKK